MSAVIVNTELMTKPDWCKRDCKTTPVWFIHCTVGTGFPSAAQEISSPGLYSDWRFWMTRFRTPSAKTWWRHEMERFSALLAICAGNSPVPGEFPTQRLMTQSFDVYFDLRPIKRLSKQSWIWWFETSSRPLWRHRNGRWEASVRCRYNAINILQNINKRDPIACPSGRGMWCLLWVQPLIDILLHFLQCWVQYQCILDFVVTALDCRSTHWGQRWGY